MEKQFDGNQSYMPCLGLEEAIVKELSEKLKFTVPVDLPCRIWLDDDGFWIAECLTLGITTFSNSEESARNSLVSRIRFDLSLRTRGLW